MDRFKAQCWDVLRNWVLRNGLLGSLPDTHELSREERAKVGEGEVSAGLGISRLRSGELDMAESINVTVRGHAGSRLLHHQQDSRE